MPQFIAERPPADLLDIFGPNCPVAIPLPVLNAELNRLLAAMPGFAAGTPEQQQEIRQLAMHEFAAYLPGDVAEVQIAARLVLLNAEAIKNVRLSNLPDTDPELALRYSRHANSVMRTLEATQQKLERRQTARRKAEETPTERAGYWFKDVSVPSAAPAPPTSDAALASGARDAEQDPVHLEPDSAAPPSLAPEQPPDPAEAPVSVPVGAVLARMAAKQWGPEQTQEQVWDQCVLEVMALARRERSHTT